MEKLDFIEMMEPTPKLLTRKCQALRTALWLFLQFFIYPTSLLVWYLYDFFIAGIALVLGFVVIGIIRAKIRNISIPYKQREYNYNDKGIATWFVATHFCFPSEVQRG